MGFEDSAARNELNIGQFARLEQPLHIRNESRRGNDLNHQVSRDKAPNSRTVGCWMLSQIASSCGIFNFCASVRIAGACAADRRTVSL